MEHDTLTIEEILDQAIKRLSQGDALAVILSSYPKRENELRPLLELSQQILAIPAQIIPTPQKHYVFLEKPTHKLFIHNLLTRIKFSTMAFVITGVIFGGFGTIYAAQQSLPGQRLFTLKRTAEQVQLSLTKDPNKRARTQLLFTEKRLFETAAILKTSPQGPHLEAAIGELSIQTKSAVAIVKAIADAKKNNTQDPALLHSLEDIAHKQQALVDTLQARVASKENTEAVAEIKKLIASVSEQTLANLPSTNAASSTESSKNTSIHTDINPGVEGVTNTKLTTPPKPTIAPETQEPEPDPNTTHAGFIPEDPSPQYVP